MFGTNAIVGKRHFKDAPKDSLYVTSLFGVTIQGEGPFCGAPAIFIRLAKCNLNCTFCFVPSTNITMADGTRTPIGQLQVGDQVLSWEKDKPVAKRVTKTFTSIATKIIEVITSNESVFCTPEHPFLTINNEWVNAEDLTIGTELILGNIIKDINILTPDDIAWKSLFDNLDTPTVYNFEVEDTHTYIANGCIVHNCDAFFDDGDWLTFKEIENKIYETVCNHWNSKGQAVPLWALPQQNNEQTKLGPYPNIVLVITGGEPLLQDNLNEFIRQQLPNFKAIQIESNGIPSTEIPDEVILVCSPKCVEKNGKAIKYLTPSETILNRADCLKFVMSAEKDSPYNEVPQWAHEWRMKTGKEIYCSPMNMYNSFPQKIKLLRAEKGTITMAERSTVDEIIDFFEPNLINMEQVEKNHKYTANYCVDHGFRFNMQLHLFAGMA